MEMKPLEESKCSDNINASYKKTLDDDNYENWTNNDVLIWIKSIENGLISKRYSNTIKQIKDLKITGAQLKTLNDLNFQSWGVSEALHRAIIMEAISTLK